MSKQPLDKASSQTWSMHITQHSTMLGIKLKIISIMKKASVSHFLTHRNIWCGLQIHNLQDARLPDTVWTNDIMNTKQQCNAPTNVLFLVVTTDRGTHTTVSPNLVNNGLKVNWSQQQFFRSVPMAVVLWISPWNLRHDNIQHTILGNILICKPLFPLQFMHMFKLWIIFHVLEILFVNNKS